MTMVVNHYEAVGGGIRRSGDADIDNKGNNELVVGGGTRASLRRSAIVVKLTRMRDRGPNVLDTKLTPDGDLRVRLGSREDRDRYVEITRIAYPGATFEILSETEVICRLPKPNRH